MKSYYFFQHEIPVPIDNAEFLFTIDVLYWGSSAMRVLSPSPTKASNYSHDLLQVFD